MSFSLELPYNPRMGCGATFFTRILYSFASTVTMLMTLQTKTSTHLSMPPRNSPFTPGPSENKKCTPYNFGQSPPLILPLSLSNYYGLSQICTTFLEGLFHSTQPDVSVVCKARNSLPLCKRGKTFSLFPLQPI